MRDDLVAIIIFYSIFVILPIVLLGFLAIIVVQGTYFSETCEYIVYGKIVYIQYDLEKNKQYLLVAVNTTLVKIETNLDKYYYVGQIIPIKVEITHLKPFLFIPEGNVTTYKVINDA